MVFLRALVMMTVISGVLRLTTSCGAGGAVQNRNSSLDAVTVENKSSSPLDKVETVLAADGSVESLTGFSKTQEADQDLLSAEDREVNADKPLFTFEPITGYQALYSDAILFTPLALTGDEADTSSCTAEERIYSEEIPRFRDLPEAEGSYLFCIRIEATQEEAPAFLVSPNFKVAQKTSSTTTEQTTGEQNQPANPHPHPQVSLSALEVFSPQGTTEGSSTTFNGSASIDSGMIQSIEVSLKAKASGKCLDEQNSFSSTCPHFRSAFVANSGKNYTFQYSVNDTLFVHGQSYSVLARATSAAGESQQSAEATYTWDAQGPQAPSSVTATGEADQITVTWSSIADAKTYMVLRKQGTQITYTPLAGVVYQTQADLGSGLKVVAITGQTTFTDSDVTAYSNYAYAVYPQDAGKNFGSANQAYAKAYEGEKFRGIDYATVLSDTRDIYASWQPFSQATQYHLFTATTSDGFDYSASPIASTSGTSLRFHDSGSGDLYLAVRADLSSGTDNNTRVKKLNFAQGSHYKISATGRAQSISLSEWKTAALRTLTVDPWGNVLIAGEEGTLAVLCRENNQAPYCRSQTLNTISTIIGTDGLRDPGATSTPAGHDGIGAILSVVVDQGGNIYLGDGSFGYIHAVCFDPGQAGFCQDKTYGYRYTVAGTGTLGDGGNDQFALTTTIGRPYGLALDPQGNVILADYDYSHLRIVCSNTSAGFCQNKNTGHLFHLAGTGSNTDGTDGVATTSAIGRPSALIADSKGNLYFGDDLNFRIRAYCADVATGNGFCSGKTVGQVYRVAGNGSDADGGDDAAALSTSLGQVYGITLDSTANIYFSDDYYRTRVYCAASAGDFCTGKDVGDVYHFSGIGSNGDGDENIFLASAQGSPLALAIDKSGNILAADNTYLRLRAYCQNTSSGFCKDKITDFHYRMSAQGQNNIGKQYQEAVSQPLGDLMGAVSDGNGNIYLAEMETSRIEVICNNVTAAGFCNGKTKGYLYFFSGTGVQGNGSDGLALARSHGDPYALAVDSAGNVYFSDFSYRLIRVVCNATNFGVCNGKSKGYMYTLVGDGSASNPGNGVNPKINGARRSNGIALDSLGNLYIAWSETWEGASVVCYDVTSSGVCQGRTAGYLYHLAGTGSPSDGDSGSATSVGTSLINGIAIDQHNNVYLADLTYERVRIICFDTSQGFCSGKTQGYMYRFLGTGTSQDGIDDTAFASHGLGTPYSLAVDSHANLYVADSFKRIRVACQEVSSAGFCKGKTIGQAYRLFGSGLDGDGGSSQPGASTPLGDVSYGGLSLTPNGALVVTDDYSTLRIFLP